MREFFAAASMLLLIAVAGGCADVTTGGDGSATKSSPGPTPTSTVTATATATKGPTVTKEPPATATTTRAVPPADPQPRGPASSCGYTSSRPTIKLGSSGAAVQQAQCYLNLSLTQDPIPEDGSFGPVTEAATRSFQDCANITADGLIGSQTWSYLIYWAGSPSYLC